MGSPKKTIQDCHDLAELKGGKFLSNEYNDNKFYHLWRCSMGHEFTKSLNKILSHGQWCPICSDQRKNIKDCQRIAEEKGGRCLSNNYVNAFSNLQWKCNNNHIWNATYANISQGSWCPHCVDKSRGERLVRYCFEKIFGCEFKKTHPDWLINPKTGKKLELDGYNEKLNIAFEHQGRHHEESLHKSHLRYNPEQSYRDELKKTKCEEQGIKLIIVPEIGRCLKEKDVVTFLLLQFDQLKITYSEQGKNFVINVKEFYAEYMPKSSDNYKPVDQFDLENNLIRTWHNASHAVYNLYNNKRSNGIYQALNGILKTAYGYKWEFSQNEKSTTGVDDLLSELDAMDFSDDSLFVDSIMDEVNDLDFDDPELFN
jgi:hypothetical protein